MYLVLKFAALMAGGNVYKWLLKPIDINFQTTNTLRNLCAVSDSSNSSKWVYAVFWRILPRNYPPPKWDYGGTALDRSKGNKRNWILVWEDGFCDFYECERAGRGYVKGRFGADVFFKMSHEVYNFGEGLVGKVAADNSHKWVFKENPNESDPNFISWNASVEPQPRAWEFHFNSGIQTIAIISVREGIIQLGSFDKIMEDLNLVINIQRNFSYLQSIPGVFAIQRPHLPIQHPYVLKPNTRMIESQETAFFVDDNRCQKTGVKRLLNERLDDSPIKSMNLGWNSPQKGTTGPPIWSIPPLLPTMSSSLGALLSRLPAVIPSYASIEAIDTSLITCTNQRARIDTCAMVTEGQFANTKVESSSLLDTNAHEEKPTSTNPNSELENRIIGFGRLREAESILSLK